jgi:glyoxylase-like metal-dependent hydrolase (beta-lactamase superfamily II)
MNLGVDNLKVTDNVYTLESTKGNYAYLILGEETVLVDTGRPGQGKGILKELESINIKPQDIQHILITHHDVDHVGNLALLEEKSRANVWASKEDLPYICGNKSRHGIKKYLSYFMRIKKPENINPYPTDQKILDIEVIPTPGHTPGHICLLYKDILFVGDLVRTSKGQIKPMRSFMNWDTDLSLESAREIADLPFKWVCPAHGEPVERNDKWESI